MKKTGKLNIIKGIIIIYAKEKRARVMRMRMPNKSEKTVVGMRVVTMRNHFGHSNASESHKRLYGCRDITPT